jgi:DNA-binding CsgD family transcriptional regulator
MIPLTELEQQIMILRAQGMTQREISNERGTTIDATNYLLDSVYNKLGALNGENAVALFFTEYVCSWCKDNKIHALKELRELKRHLKEGK